MAIDQWPVQDQAAWRIAFTPTSPLDPRPNGAAFAPRTRITMETAYARWLLWLTGNDPAALPLAPAARTTEARVLAYAHAMIADITLRTLISYVSRLQTVMELIAPAQDWTWFRPILRRIERRARAEASAHHPVVPSDRLFRFGLDLMAEAEADDALSATRRAEVFRDGLAIALLAARPLRLTNFIELRIGEHVTRTPDGYRVAIPAEQTKNRMALEFMLPARLVPFLDRYLDMHRPVLLQPDPAVPSSPGGTIGALWVTRRGRPLPSDSFADMIARRTLARFGVRLTPHGFRHAAATTIAETAPKEVLIIRLILGHTTTATAERHYVHATRIRATQRFQQTLEHQRRSTRPPRGARG